jgi:hypothetical protein
MLLSNEKLGTFGDSELPVHELNAVLANAETIKTGTAPKASIALLRLACFMCLLILINLPCCSLGSREAQRLLIARSC